MSTKKHKARSYRWIIEGIDFELVIRKDTKTIMFSTCKGEETQKRRQFQRIDIPNRYKNVIADFLWKD